MYDVYEWNKTKLSSDLGFFFVCFLLVFLFFVANVLISAHVC